MFSTFVDGLSIPFFSIGRHTLTMSRSLAGYQPDWLLWVRRDAPQAGAERAISSSEEASAVVAEGSLGEQKRVELSCQSDLPDSAHKVIETPKGA